MHRIPIYSLRLNMKEKRAPSPQSRLGCFGLFVAVFMSCALIWWFGAINPYSAPARFSLANMSWNSDQKSLTLLQSSYDQTAYILNKEGHLSCVRHHIASEDYDRSLTWEQRTNLEEHYGEIFDQRMFDDGTVVLSIDYAVQYVGIPFTSYDQKLLLLRNMNDVVGELLWINRFG
jgi:hypothetical protein